jgi:histidinol-phosphatase
VPDLAPHSADDFADDLAFALALADAADEVTMRHFRTGLAVETKPDLSPVTEADRAVERLLRSVVERERPGDAVVGEEYGATGGEALRRWVFDPIDGTKGYVRGLPVWATLIALQVHGEGVVGVVSAPALGRRWWASSGSGAYADGVRLHVSKVAALGDAHLSYSSLPGWGARRAAFLALADKCWRTRAFGDFWSYVLVAEGAVDVAAEPEVSLWDLAALQVVVEEAGGRFTDLAGNATPDGGSAVATNGLLHDAVLAALAPDAT